MVYEEKCSECGNLIDFGGEKNEELPENAIRFDNKVYCRECVERFVQFGSASTSERMESLEEKVKDIRKELGLS